MQIVKKTGSMDITTSFHVGQPAFWLDDGVIKDGCISKIETVVRLYDFGHPLTSNLVTIETVSFTQSGKVGTQKSTDHWKDCIFTSKKDAALFMLERAGFACVTTIVEEMK